MCVHKKKEDVCPHQKEDACPQNKEDACPQKKEDACPLCMLQSPTEWFMLHKMSNDRRTNWKLSRLEYKAARRTKRQRSQGGIAYSRNWSRQFTCTCLRFLVAMPLLEELTSRLFDPPPEHTKGACCLITHQRYRQKEPTAWAFLSAKDTQNTLKLVHSLQISFSLP